MIDIHTFDIEGPRLLKLKKMSDERGFFVERYKESYNEILGIKKSFVQDNFSRSVKNVVRGLHLQHSPGQGKLVSCLSGEIRDIVIDVRQKSPTYGKSIAVHLKDDEPSLFWVPAGFAHGFSVLSDYADVLYKVDCHYAAVHERAIVWNDPELNLNWMVSQPIVSDKDSKALTFKDYKKDPVF
jgi:dTDP-4-dehydrorhamnose 3,5-epimerase